MDFRIKSTALHSTTHYNATPLLDCISLHSHNFTAFYSLHWTTTTPLHFMALYSLHFSTTTPLHFIASPLLHCTSLLGAALYIALHQHCMPLHYTEWFSAIHCTVFDWTSLHGAVPHFTEYHNISIALHYTAFSSMIQCSTLYFILENKTVVIKIS